MRVLKKNKSIFCIGFFTGFLFFFLLGACVLPQGSTFRIFPKKTSQVKKPKVLKKQKLKKNQVVDSKHQATLKRVKKLFHNAQKYSATHKNKKALLALNKILETPNLSASFLKPVYQLKEFILLKQNPPDLVSLLQLFLSALEDLPQKKQLYESKALKVLFRLKEKQVLFITKKDFIEPIKDMVFFRAGKILFFRGQFQKADWFFKQALRFSRQGLLEQTVLKYIHAIASRNSVNFKRLGAVLPLSGASRLIGRRSLQGLQLGLGFYTNQASNFQLAVMDSKGLAEKVKKAVKTLVLKHHVIAIVGGVLSKTAKILAQEAQNFGVPVILLSQKTGLTQYGEYVFQNGLTSSLVVHQLTSFLMQKKSVKKYALLYPNDPYGVDYANSFWQMLKKKQAQLTAVQVYKPKQTDFNGSIKRLIGTYYKEDRLEEYKQNLKNWYINNPPLSKRKAIPEGLLAPVVNFKALFVPDSPKTLSLIASHLDYNDVQDIYLVGTTLWNKDNKIKFRYKGKIFFATINFQSKKFKKSKFYKDFQNTFHRSPGLFETQAYESSLVLRQVIAGGGKERSRLKNDLLALKKFYSPLGWIQINTNREFIRPLSIYKIENRRQSLVKGLDL